MNKDTIIEPRAPLSAVSSGADFSFGFNTGSVVGKFLVASPLLQDSCFAKAVIYVCQHSKSGAMGVIINHQLHNVNLDDVLEQMNISSDSSRHLGVHFGGPVDGNRGFIVHSDDFMERGAIFHDNGIAVTSNADVLKAIALGCGPRHGILALGYAGWSGGQLEAEMETGSWIVSSATPQLLFETQNEMKWSLAIASLGFDIGNFSTAVGHA